MIRRLFRRRPSWYEEAAAYLDGELRGPARAEFEDALTRSADLRAYLEDLRATKQAIAALPPVQVPRSFTISVAQARAATRAPRLERRPTATAGGGGWFAGAALVRSVAAFSVVAVAALAAVITVDIAGDNGQGPRQGEAEAVVAAEQRTASALRQESAEQTAPEAAAAQTARAQIAPAGAEVEQALDQTAQSAPAPAAPAPAEEPTAAEAPAPAQEDAADVQSEAAEETPPPEADGTEAISASAPTEAGDVAAAGSDTADDSQAENATLAEDGDVTEAQADPAGDAESTADAAVAQAAPAPDDADVTEEATPAESPTPSVAPEEPATEDLPATGGGLAHEPDFDAEAAEEPGDDADITAEVEQAEFATEQATLGEDAADQAAEAATETAPAAAPAEPDAVPSPTAILADSDDGADVLLIALEIALGALVGLSLVTLFVVIRRRA